MPCPPKLSSRSLIVLLLLGTALAGCDRRSAAPEQDNAATPGEVTSGEVPSSPKGDSGASYVIDTSKAGSALPDFVFTDGSGKDVTLDRFAGQPILINLWATWCAPCVAEMPQLDEIAGIHGKDGLVVLTISQDTLGADKVLPLFKAKGFKHLKPCLDPENQFGFHYGTGVLPTSVLYNADGKEVARVTGALDWHGEEAERLIAQAIDN